MYLNLRIKIFFYFIALLFVLLSISLFKIQIIDGATYRSRSENNRIRLIPIKTTRGRIYDRNKEILADNKPSFTLELIPKDFSLDYLQELSNIISLSSDTIKKKIDNRTTPSFVPLTLKRDLTKEEVFKIEERKLDFGGLRVVVNGKRFYPWNSVAAHILGYLSKMSKNDYVLKKHMGYLIDDYVGRAGIEYLFEEVLRGVHGGRQIEVNAKGRLMKEIAYKPPFQGGDLTLTLDIKLQKAVCDYIGDKVASVCIMDVKSGEILALISTPSFDPNAFVTPSRSSERMKMFKDKSLPFLNRAITAKYPPGSVFKIVTALAALEAGKITEHTTFECTGGYKLSPNSRVFHCWSKYGHGDVALEKALQQSCNVYFYKIGKMLGVDAIARFSKKIGLGDSINIELPGGVKGLIPSSAWKKERFNEKWYQGETLNFSIGQGYLLITPLQVMRLIAIIANDGKIVEPTIIKGVKNKEKRLGLNKYHVKLIKKGMLKAVETRFGTAHLAQVDFFEMAAKTGTAQTNGEPHSWFAGFFPYKKPEIAIAVVVEHGGVGGGKAAVIAKEAATVWHELKGQRN